MSANDPKRTSGESASYRKRTSLRSTSQDLWALKSVNRLLASVGLSGISPFFGCVSYFTVRLAASIPRAKSLRSSTLRLRQGLVAMFTPFYESIHHAALLLLHAIATWWSFVVGKICVTH